MPVTIAGTTGTTQPTATCTTSLVLTGSSSGTTTVQAAATASGTITVPAGTGTVAVNGVSSNLVVTSGTVSSSAVAFTGIPSWVKRLTFAFSGLQTNGTGQILFQLGVSGSYTTSGYLGSTLVVGTSANSGNATTGVPIWWNTNVAANVYHGSIVVNLADLTSNTWTISGCGGVSNATSGWFAGYSVPLASALAQVRISTTDTFTAGKVNLLYE